MKSVQDIIKHDLCVGCGLCEALDASSSISMQYSETGYLRPELSEPAVSQIQAEVLQCCPGINMEMPVDGGDAPWGPIRSLQFAHAHDEKLRFRASSGGALSAILNFLLEMGTVDSIVQTGADQADPLGNKTTLSESVDAVFDAAGSRYAPSAPLAILGSLMEHEDKRFAVVGKPCDIVAIRRWSRENQLVSERFPILISFFCGGIPSRVGAQRITEQLGVSEADIAEFTYRGNGWPGRASATTHDGTSASMSYDESWGTILNRHLQLRCKICPDSIGESADIVCADGWHLDGDKNPLFDERPGRSIVLARSELGERILKDICTRGDLVTEPCALEELNNMQPYQRKRKALVLSRLLAMRLCGKQTPGFPIRALLEAAKNASLLDHLRSFSGMLVRALKN